MFESRGYETMRLLRSLRWAVKADGSSCCRPSHLESKFSIPKQSDWIKKHIFPERNSPQWWRFRVAGQHDPFATFPHETSGCITASRCGNGAAVSGTSSPKYANWGSTSASCACGTTTWLTAKGRSENAISACATGAQQSGKQDSMMNEPAMEPAWQRTCNDASSSDHRDFCGSHRSHAVMALPLPCSWAAWRLNSRSLAGGLQP